MLTKQFLVISSIIVSLLMVVIVNLVRMKSTKKPVIAKNILLPPLFMATGGSMFILPMFRPTFSELIGAVVMGMIFSSLLIKTSKFEVRNSEIYLQRSKYFLAALIGLVTLRMIGKIILSETIYIDPAQMSGMFFILAYSMILPWRIAMYIEFKKIKKQLERGYLNEFTPTGQMPEPR